MKTIKLLSVALLATFALTPLSAQKSKRKLAPLLFLTLRIDGFYSK